MEIATVIVPCQDVAFHEPPPMQARAARAANMTPAFVWLSLELSCSSMSVRLPNKEPATGTQSIHEHRRDSLTAFLPGIDDTPKCIIGSGKNGFTIS